MLEDNKDGIFKNIIGVIISPKETMERVNKNPRIWGYLISVTLIQLLIALIGMPKIISFAVLQGQQMANAPQVSVSVMKTMAIVTTISTAIISPALFVLITSAVIKLVTVILKQTANFKNLYCVNILAYVPILISAILTAIIMLFTEPQNVKNISTSLTLLLSSSTDRSSTIYKLFSGINFFYIWSAVLSAIGISIVCKMNMKKSAAIVTAIYIISVVVMILA